MSDKKNEEERIESNCVFHNAADRERRYRSRRSEAAGRVYESTAELTGKQTGEKSIYPDRHGRPVYHEYVIQPAYDSSDCHCDEFVVRHDDDGDIESGCWSEREDS